MYSCVGATHRKLNICTLCPCKASLPVSVGNNTLSNVLRAKLADAGTDWLIFPGNPSNKRVVISRGSAINSLLVNSSDARGILMTGAKTAPANVSLSAAIHLSRCSLVTHRRWSHHRLAFSPIRGYHQRCHSC